jgi:threonine aldolase
MIDLRSDTVTRPTVEMRNAMATAEVGDDVYGEDPTVNALEKRAAELLGKEAALFVPTGTMGNSIAIKLHTRHGEEVICDARSHVVDWELSMMAWFAGCLARPIDTVDGILTWELIKRTIRKATPHNAPTTLITLENTHNMAGGTVYPIEVIDEICDEAHRAGIKVHIDGARIFNASTAIGISAARIAENADSVMFCLSKGLGAPVGSLLAGRGQDIEQARLYRKRLGGGMRQAGVLAAAGLVALETMTKRLGDDHANARLLAERLASLPGIEMNPASVRTNIVIFKIEGCGVSSAQFLEELQLRGVLANGVGSNRIRFVTHADVIREQCEVAAQAVEAVVTARRSFVLSTT